MKLITFTVPCYNSQDYMHKCIDSLLTGGDDVEIIIVNDGSKDDTGKIADAYAEKYPEIVKVIHKENGGHGSGVNAGVHAAQGLYFKVVDSDDWLNTDALQKLITTMKEHIAEGKTPDLYVCNFVYYHPSDNTQYVSEYTTKMKPGFIDWKKVKKFHYSHTMMMHALVFNTKTLREHYVELPEHTFYVDNILAYAPFPYLLNAYYLNENLYYYLTGRDGQSVNIDTAISRYKQQITVMLMMCKSLSYDQINALPKGLRNYVFHYLIGVMMNTLMFACAINTKERRIDVKNMWKEIKKTDKKLYRKIKYRGYPLSCVILPWCIRGKIMRIAYNIILRKVHFG